MPDFGFWAYDKNEFSNNMQIGKKWETFILCKIITDGLYKQVGLFYKLVFKF